MEIQPAQKITLIDSVREQLLHLIKEGHLRPGDMLPSERELMERLQVGRSSVREALRSLATLRVIEIRPGRGAFVRDPGAADILPAETLAVLLNKDTMMEIVEARIVLESALAGMAAERATPEDLDRIEGILARMRECTADVEESLALNAEFHLAVAETARNNVLLNMLQSVRDYLKERLSEISRDQSRIQQSLKGHTQIFEAIRSGDVNLAAATMRHHLDEVRRQVEAMS